MADIDNIHTKPPLADTDTELLNHALYFLFLSVFLRLWECLN